MTRINVIDPSLLSSEHLGAEYRELPRVFGLVKEKIAKGISPEKCSIPATYRLGKGHVKFFYNKLGYLARRYVDICHECRIRGRAVNYGDVKQLTHGIGPEWMGEWTPTSDAIQLNLARINDRGGLREIVPDQQNPLVKEPIMENKIRVKQNKFDIISGPLDAPTDEKLKEFRVWLVNEIIANDPAIRMIMFGMKMDSIVYRSEEKKAVVEEFVNFLRGFDDEDKAIRAFKNQYNKERILYSPEDDGVTHINVYSRAKTELGQLLSNFAHTPFIHPKDGYFASVEAYWYWLSLSDGVNDTENVSLRNLYGYRAKEIGRILRKKAEECGCERKVEDFEARIKKAILCKIEQNDDVKKLLKECTLPLTHYYVWGKDGGEQKISYPSDYAWIHEYISLVRDWLQGNAQKLLVAGSRTIIHKESANGSREEQLVEIEENFKNLQVAYAVSPYLAVEIVSGMANGPDMLGVRLAKVLKLPVAEFPADWNGPDQKAAGFVRNEKMADYADAGLILWDGESRGTKDMMNRLDKHHKPYVIARKENGPWKISRKDPT